MKWAAFYSMTINQKQTLLKIKVDLVILIQSTNAPDLEEDCVSCRVLKLRFSFLQILHILCEFKSLTVGRSPGNV